MNTYRLGFKLGFMKRAGYFGDLWGGVKGIGDLFKGDTSAYDTLGTDAAPLPFQSTEKEDVRSDRDRTYPWTKPFSRARGLHLGSGPSNLADSFGKVNIPFSGGSRGINPKDFKDALPFLKKRIMEGKLSHSQNMPAEETKERIDRVQPRTNQMLRADHEMGEYGVQQGTTPEFSWWDDPSVLGYDSKTLDFVKRLPQMATGVGDKDTPLQLKKLEPRLIGRLGQEYK
jgi:hypothetical protein